MRRSKIPDAARPMCCCEPLCGKASSAQADTHLAKGSPDAIGVGHYIPRPSACRANLAQNPAGRKALEIQHGSSLEYGFGFELLPAVSRHPVKTKLCFGDKEHLPFVSELNGSVIS
jgi:hypothetical protein